MAGGTVVDVNLALERRRLVTADPAQNAIVFRGITATPPTPTVYIGENNQATGLVTIAEQAAGFFQAGTGANNMLAVCLLDARTSLHLAPWAKVTAGDLRLREGDVASPDNIVQGSHHRTAPPDCYYWTVWTASTTASTIVIGNDAVHAPARTSTSQSTQAPGHRRDAVHSGNSRQLPTTSSSRPSASPYAAFRNQVAVTALSQPTIPAGAVTKAGEIQIAETANGQLKAGEEICFEIMPRAALQHPGQVRHPDQALNTAQLPVVTASGGLVVSPVRITNEGCCAEGRPRPPGQVISFAFHVLQQSTNGTGKLVIATSTSSPWPMPSNGPVLVNVWGVGGSADEPVHFQAQVSNAKIGVKPAIAISSTSALGLMPNQGAWTTATKVPEANQYVTWRFIGGSALAGKLVQIQVAAKNSNGGWGPFGTLTSAKADASGTAYFQWRSRPLRGSPSGPTTPVTSARRVVVACPPGPLEVTLK